MALRVPDSPPIIKPVPLNESRPLWSVMIPIYNSSELLKEALHSVLIQDPGKEYMQIEVVDDCSTDADVKSLVEELGKGRVIYFRQDTNVGSVRNFETCLNRSRGMIIHLLHSDDLVKPGFYSTLANVFDKFPEAGAVFCNYESINDEGERMYDNESMGDKEMLLDNFLYTVAYKCPIQYVAIGVKREVYEKVGGFYGCIYGEDWEMWSRIARDYPVAYSPAVLAKYRIHLQNISGSSFETGSNFKDIDWVIKTINTYLPQKDQAVMKLRAKKHYANYMLSMIEYIWHVTKNKRIVYTQVRGVLKMHVNPKMVLKAAKMYAKVWAEPVRRILKF